MSRQALQTTVRRCALTGVAALVAAAGVLGVATGVQAATLPVPLPHVLPAVAGPTTATTGTNAPLGLSDLEHLIGSDTSVAAGAAGQGIDVAVLDTGVTPVQGLNGPNKLVYGPDLSTDSQNPATAYLDGYGHGTAMASIIAGNDGTPGGFTGVAPSARIVSVKVGAANGSVDVSQIIAGIDWVTQHAHSNGLNVRVLNLSLGTDSIQPSQVDPLDYATEQAWLHGIVVVVAVGNDGPSTGVVNDPATDPYVLGVGAEDPNGTLTPSDDVVTDFSNVGLARHADVVAPGAYVVGLRDPGSTLDTEYPAARIGTRFFRGSGTSQAAAFTSGAVADLLSAHPGLTPDQVKSYLMASAVPIATTSPNAAGAGLIDIPAAEGESYPVVPQVYAPATGLGSLELARGSQHIQIGGVTLTGEVDVLGNPWTPAVSALESAASAWTGGVWNGASWSGASWSGASWSGASWSGASWSGASWSGASWSGASWSGASWSGASWSGASWSGASWSGASWSGATWS
jgi:serine protease AprX